MPRAHTIPIADPAKPERSLTPAKIKAAVDVPTRGQRIYWVQGVGLPPRFGLLVRPPSATHRFNAIWIVQAMDPRGIDTRLKVARYGDMPVRDVLERAVELRGKIQDGTHRERKDEARAAADRNSFTVGDAFQVWFEHLEQHARPSTIYDAFGKAAPEDVTSGRLRVGYVQKHLGDWLRLPLAGLTKAELIKRHRYLTRASGPRVANKVLKALRSAWNCALDVYEDLPANPLHGRRAFRWNHEPEGGPAVAEHELVQWWKDVHELPAVLRDFFLVVLFTGARKTVVASLPWEHVDLDRGIVHFAEPKGGPKKAYTIPVASFMVELLRRRRAEVEGPLVFPSPGKHGVPIGRTLVEGMPDTQMLRRTWITAADDLISQKQAERLTNHGPRSNTAHSRYIIPGEDKLRAAAEKVAAFLLERAGVEWRARDVG